MENFFGGAGQVLCSLFGWYGVSNYPTLSLTFPYDPTNGLIGNGGIIYTRASANGYRNVREVSEHPRND